MITGAICNGSGEKLARDIQKLYIRYIEFTTVKTTNLYYITQTQDFLTLFFYYQQTVTPRPRSRAPWP